MVATGKTSPKMGYAGSSVFIVKTKTSKMCLEVDNCGLNAITIIFLFCFFIVIFTSQYANPQVHGCSNWPES